MTTATRFKVSYFLLKPCGHFGFVPETFFVCFPLTQVIVTFFVEITAGELVGEAVAVAEVFAVAVGEAEAVGVATGVGVGEDVATGVGVGDGVGFGAQMTHSMPGSFKATPGLPTIL